MQLIKQDTSTVENNLRRIFPNITRVTVRCSSHGTIEGVLIETPTGSTDFSQSSYNFCVNCTVPKKVYRATFSAFGTEVQRDFDSEEDRSTFVYTLDSWRQEIVKLSTVEI